MSKPLQFQINGAKKLYNILQSQRSAFLADEVGLGKTYTSTILIQLMAKEKMSKSGNKDPFRVLYVGPSKALVQKNCSDMIAKYNNTSVIDESSKTEEKPPELRYLNEYNENEAVFEKVREYLKTKEKNICKKVLDYVYCAFEKKYKENYIKKYDDRPQNARVKTIREAWSEAINELNKCYIGGRNGLAKNIYESESAGLSGLNGYVPHDRLLLLGSLVSKQGEGVQLASTSIQLMGRQAERNKYEKNHIGFFLSKNSNISEISDDELKELKKKAVEMEADIYKKFDLVIFDEYHRYFESIDFQNKEKCRLPKLNKGKGPKLLFVSATPYKVGKVAGNVEEIYEEDSLSELPAFEDFTRLVYEDYEQNVNCGSSKKVSSKKLIDLNTNYINAINKVLEIEDKNSNEENDKNEEVGVVIKKAEVARDKLQAELKKRMVRHERALLGNNKNPEEHNDLSKIDCLEKYKVQILNMFNERKLLKKFKYNGNALRWGSSMPYLLSFSQRYGICTDISKNYFIDLVPREKKGCQEIYTEDEKKQLKSLFIPEGNDYSDLPNKNITFHHICENQVKDNQRLRIWMPATRQTHEIGEKSIYHDAISESKLVVFAEATCMQRGGAYLISQYADGQNLKDISDWEKWDKESLKKAKKIIKDGLKYSKEDKHEKIGDRENESPYYCIRRLNHNYNLKMTDKEIEKFQEAFKAYFNRDAIKNALLAWMYSRRKDFFDCNGSLSGPNPLEVYCYEGNLYSVLEEWLFCNSNNIEGVLTLIDTVLNKDGTKEQIRPLYLDEYCDGKINENPSAAKKLAFAERLTSDILDNGASGTSDENESNSLKMKIIDAFNSPFYPMVLFVGKGAQEGFDLHYYSNRIMHMTLPNGPVSFDQRQGRIDRFHSLLVRKRVSEIISKIDKTCKKSWEEISKMSWDDMFSRLNKIGQQIPCWCNDKIFPNWQISEYKKYKSQHHFERIVPILKYTSEHVDYVKVLSQLASYRSTMGTSHVNKTENYIVDLSVEDGEVYQPV